MIINTQSNAFADVLYTPSYSVPSLSDREILSITVDAIRAFLAEKIDFQTLLDVITNIKLFSGMRKNTNGDLTDIFAKTSLLSKKEYREDKSENVKAFLNDLVNKLTTK